MNVHWTTAWRVSLPKGVVLWSPDKKLLLNSAWRPTHVSDFSLCVVQRLTPPFFLLFFFFLQFSLGNAWKKRRKAILELFFWGIAEEKKRKICKAIVWGKALQSFLISVASLHLMVVRPSPLAGKLSMGLLVVHSSHMWFRTLVLERRKKLEIFSRSQRVIQSSGPPYLRTVKKFSHMEWMYVWPPPGEFLCERGWSYDQQMRSFYWNQPEAHTHVSVIFCSLFQ